MAGAVRSSTRDRLLDWSSRRKSDESTKTEGGSKTKKQATACAVLGTKQSRALLWDGAGESTTPGHEGTRITELRRGVGGFTSLKVELKA